MHSQTIGHNAKDLPSLKRAMRGNGIFSALSALILMIAAKPLTTFLGLSSEAVLIGLGIVLMLYAVALFQVTSRPSLVHRFGYTAVALDVAWVIGSIAILVSGWPALTVAGKWTVALLAEAVAFFAVWQAVALRKLE